MARHMIGRIATIVVLICGAVCVPAAVRSEEPVAARAAQPTAHFEPSASKPLVFFQQRGGTYAGSRRTETDDARLSGHVHDRLLELLPPIFGTTLVNREVRDDGTQTLMSVCRANAAAGFVETTYAFSLLEAQSSHGAFTIMLRGCGGTTFASATGGSAKPQGRLELIDLMDPAIDEAVARLRTILAASPRSLANLKSVGLYMDDNETDSMWLPRIDGKRVVVDECDPMGTAARAGLHAGDEVVTINGESVTGVDQTHLNAIMISALRHGAWTLGVRAGATPVHSVTFVNQTAAWYAANPL